MVNCIWWIIATSDDVWQLNRLYNDSKANGRTRVYARRRLIELKTLVPYKWSEVVTRYAADYRSPDEPGYEDWKASAYQEEVKYNYATPAKIEKLEEAKARAAASGHFFTDGTRVDLQLRRVDSFDFETQYGRTYVEHYVAPDGKMFKYMGNSPADISETEFTMVKATVKWDNYKGQPETKLQRIKVIECTK